MSSEPSKSEGPPAAEATGVNTLGHVRLRHEVTNEIILIPTPSEDPKDPLNWRVPSRVANIDGTQSNAFATGPELSSSTLPSQYASP